MVFKLLYFSNSKIALILLLTLFYSCSSYNNPELEEAQSEWVGKQLTLNFDAPEKLHDKGTYTGSKKTYNLIHYFNSDCSICITELEEWSEFLSDIDNTENVNIAFIASGNNVLYLKYLWFLTMTSTQIKQTVSTSVMTFHPIRDSIVL